MTVGDGGDGSVLYGLVRQHLESFLAHAREHYESGLPRYVEQELRAYLKCGVFSRGALGSTRELLRTGLRM
jgi:hypothetical protein